MANYDFTQLSDVEFEELIRDLLQKDLGCKLESFESGRDKGIDLRYSQNPANSLVVQCKHYAVTGWNGLKSHLKNSELPKIRKLSTSRYLLATSVGLTVGKVDTLLQLLAPFCKSSGDIYGKRRINGLLRDYPEIEEKHFKLWMSSLPVLRRILKSKIITHSEFEIGDIKQRIRRYVQTQSFSDARRVLEQTNYCIIAGDPGIGKTTLAELLVIDYLNRGYEPIVLANIDDVTEAFSATGDQVFYFDDFLGKISVELDLSGNADQKILNFIRKVKSYKNKRLILTTREYILAKAEILSEKLNQSHLSSTAYTIDLKKYTKMDQARILYNHIYCSDLPNSHKEQLLSNQNYMRIIEHPNYNPRIIEWMTDAVEGTSLAADKYVDAFVENLDNPAKLWDHCIRQQLSDSERNFLTVLSTAGSSVFLADVRKAFEAFQLVYSQHYNTSFSPQSFRNAIRRLQGNFIVIQRERKGDIISFKNASIQDFFAKYLIENVQILGLLCESAVFFSQLSALWRFINRNRNEIAFDSELTEKLLGSIRRTFLEKDWQLTNWGSSGSNESYKDYSSPIESRLTSAIKLSKASNVGTSLMKELSRLEIERLAAKDWLSNRDGVRYLLTFFEELNFEFVDKRTFLEAIKIHIIGRPSWLNEFDNAFEFLRKYPEFITDTDRTELRERFEELCEEPDFEHLEDESEIRNARKHLERIGKMLKVEIEYALERLEDRANEIEEAQSESTAQSPARRREVALDSRIIDRQIHSMFDLLKDAHKK